MGNFSFFKVVKQQKAKSIILLLHCALEPSFDLKLHEMYGSNILTICRLFIRIHKSILHVESRTHTLATSPEITFWHDRYPSNEKIVMKKTRSCHWHASHFVISPLKEREAFLSNTVTIVCTVGNDVFPSESDVLTSLESWRNSLVGLFFCFDEHQLELMLNVAATRWCPWFCHNLVCSRLLHDSLHKNKGRGLLFFS